MVESKDVESKDVEIENIFITIDNIHVPTQIFKIIIEYIQKNDLANYIMAIFPKQFNKLYYTPDIINLIYSFDVKLFDTPRYGTSYPSEINWAGWYKVDLKPSPQITYTQNQLCRFIQYRVALIYAFVRAKRLNNQPAAGWYANQRTYCKHNLTILTKYVDHNDADLQKCVVRVGKGVDESNDKSVGKNTTTARSNAYIRNLPETTVYAFNDCRNFTNARNIYGDSDTIQAYIKCGYNDKLMNLVHCVYITMGRERYSINAPFIEIIMEVLDQFISNIFELSELYHCIARTPVNTVKVFRKTIHRHRDRIVDGKYTYGTPEYFIDDEWKRVIDTDLNMRFFIHEKCLYCNGSARTRRVCGNTEQRRLKHTNHQNPKVFCSADCMARFANASDEWNQCITCHKLITSFMGLYCKKCRK